jgi:hypothetical protein
MVAKSKDEEAEACSTDGRYEKHKKIWSENLKGRKRSEDLGVDGKITLELILNRVGECELDASDSG